MQNKLATLITLIGLGIFISTMFIMIPSGDPFEHTVNFNAILMRALTGMVIFGLGGALGVRAKSRELGMTRLTPKERPMHSVTRKPARTRECTHCGHKNRGANAYCGRCGSSLK